MLSDPLSRVCPAAFFEMLRALGLGASGSSPLVLMHRPLSDTCRLGKLPSKSEKVPNPGPLGRELELLYAPQTPTS